MDQISAMGGEPAALFPESGLRRTAEAAKLPIAVVGAGFSGTMAAIHLVRRLPPDQPILLCERAPDFARGVAYATTEDSHLLNVRVSSMSAFADDELHFAGWLQARTRAAGGILAGLHETEAGLFASRGLYGQYLRSILDHALRLTEGNQQLRLLGDEVQDVEVAPGGGLRLICRGRKPMEVAGIVLAVGNLPPEEADDPRICADPWSEKAWQGLSGDLPVLIMGTGLTMVDLAVAIRQQGFAGPIVAMSRGGLLPARHAPAEAWPTPDFTMAEKGSVARLTARIRHEVREAAERGVDWRGVIDSLRPITAGLWIGLNLAERQRFLRHLRRYWDVHRHRMAPPHAEQIDTMQREGGLRVLAGRIVVIESRPGSLVVQYRPRGGSAGVLAAQRVIFARGAEPIGRTRDVLVQRLLDRGLLRLDSQGIGIDADDRLNAIGGDGAPTRRIWALGPIVRGVFWECVAVPDIRLQAARLAESITPDEGFGGDGASPPGQLSPALENSQRGR